MCEHPDIRGFERHGVRFLPGRNHSASADADNDRADVITARTASTLVSRPWSLLSPYARAVGPVNHNVIHCGPREARYPRWLDVQPGNRILEIGAGTGYNACLLAKLARRADVVTTIDIDSDVTAKASQALAETGYGDVHVITGNGGFGYPDHAPDDRMIATVSPSDIPVAWWNQLAPGGRLVAPLRWQGQGQGRSVALTYTDSRLISDSLHLCGFVYLRGEYEGELSGSITADEPVTLHWDRDQAVGIAALRGVLDQPRVTAWSETTIARNESHDGLWLRLTITDPPVCRLKVDADVPREVCDPDQRMVAHGLGQWRHSALPHRPPHRNRR